jgi:hypothetical protein
MRTTHPHGQNEPSRLNPGAAAMGALSRIPHFPGKGRATLLILRLYRRKLPLRARTPNGGWIWLADDDAGCALSVIRPSWPQGARLDPATAQDAGRYQDTQNLLAVPRTQT